MHTYYGFTMHNQRTGAFEYGVVQNHGVEKSKFDPVEYSMHSMAGKVDCLGLLLDDRAKRAFHPGRDYKDTHGPMFDDRTANKALAVGLDSKATQQLYSSVHDKQPTPHAAQVADAKFDHAINTGHGMNSYRPNKHNVA